MDPKARKLSAGPLEYLTKEQVREIHSAALEIQEDLHQALDKLQHVILNLSRTYYWKAINYGYLKVPVSSLGWVPGLKCPHSQVFEKF